MLALSVLAPCLYYLHIILLLIFVPTSPSTPLTRVCPNRGKPTIMLPEFWSSVVLCSVLFWPGAKMPETAEHGFWLVLPGLEGSVDARSLDIESRACYGLVWSGLVWSIWSGLVWSGLVYLVWSGLVWSGLVWSIWSGLVWSIWSGLVWSGLVWSGLVWYGVVEKNALLHG